MASPALQRAVILQRQNRHADAIRELHQHLTTAPRDAIAHAILADSLVELEKYDDAEREAGEAVGLAPDQAFGHAAIARVLLKRNKFRSAERSIRDAIMIDSSEPSYFATLGAILVELRQWKSALDAADQGLAIDPKHGVCLNIRAIALTHLGERESASLTMEGALAENPENAFTHANHGWTLLHRNKPKEAMEHFREALRLDPTLTFAKAGIIEAMKARNPLYRLLLQYFLFMARMNRRLSMAIMIGGYLGYRYLVNLANENPAVGPYVWPIVIAYVVFALSTWLAPTLFNLVLRFHPFGRHALSPEQRITSSMMAVALLLALGFGAAYLSQRVGWMLVATFATLGVALPLSLLFACARGWPRWTMAGILIVLALTGTMSVVLVASPDSIDQGFDLFQLFAYGCVGSQIGGQLLVTAKPKK